MNFEWRAPCRSLKAEPTFWESRQRVDQADIIKKLSRVTHGRTKVDITKVEIETLDVFDKD